MSTVPRRSPNATRVVAGRTYVVRSHRDRLSIVALVRCPHCQDCHLIFAPLDADRVRRTAGCKLGKLEVILGVVRTEAAAA